MFSKPDPTARMRLTIKSLAKSYAATTVFEDVDLQVSAGEFVAIIGESGVGKSTLLNCMAGLDRWDRGQITLEGQDLNLLDDQGLALLRRHQIGFVFQAFHVLPHLNVEQNIALPLMLLGRAPQPRVGDMMRAVGLQGLEDRLPQALSGGQLQRVAIARALVHQPVLLLADEPTGNLDPHTADMVLDALVDQAKQHGSSLVLVTHSKAAAARADRILQLREDGLFALPHD